MKTDVVIIGGGYYGCAAAIEIRAARPDLDVIVLDKEPELFSRASSTNQGQLHAGYMYSKFPELARECAHSAKEFIQLYGEAVNQDVTTYYGIHTNSEISPTNYEAFCSDVGLPLEQIDNPPEDFFGPSLTRVYATAEKTFDNIKLHALMNQRLSASGVTIITSFSAARIAQAEDGIEVVSTDGRSIHARTIFNATFADSNTLHQNSHIQKLPLEHAVFLHFLVQLPDKCHNMGLIAVRGNYAALAPAQGDASHVFASGQFRIVRTSHIDAPKETIAPQEITSRYEQAVAEASGYMPILQSAQLVGHTIGTRTNYINPTTGVASSRAVVTKNYSDIKGYHCIFGGKVTCLPEIAEPVRQIAREISAN